MDRLTVEDIVEALAAESEQVKAESESTYIAFSQDFTQAFVDGHINLARLTALLNTRLDAREGKTDA